MRAQHVGGSPHPHARTHVSESQEMADAGASAARSAALLDPQVPYRTLCNRDRGCALILQGSEHPRELERIVNIRFSRWSPENAATARTCPYARAPPSARRRAAEACDCLSVEWCLACELWCDLWNEWRCIGLCSFFCRRLRGIYALRRYLRLIDHDQESMTFPYARQRCRW